MGQGRPAIKFNLTRGSKTYASDDYFAKFVANTKDGKGVYKVNIPSTQRYEQANASFSLDAKSKSWKEKTLALDVRYGFAEGEEKKSTMDKLTSKQKKDHKTKYVINLNLS